MIFWANRTTKMLPWNVTFARLEPQTRNLVCVSIAPFSLYISIVFKFMLSERYGIMTQKRDSRRRLTLHFIRHCVRWWNDTSPFGLIKMRWHEIFKTHGSYNRHLRWHNSLAKALYFTLTPFTCSQIDRKGYKRAQSKVAPPAVFSICNKDLSQLNIRHGVVFNRHEFSCPCLGIDLRQEI